MMLLVTIALQVTPVPAEVHNFENWAVACDNGLTCQAVSLMPEGQFDENSRILLLERGPEADAPLQLTLVGLEAAPAQMVVYDDPIPARFTASGGDYDIALENRATFVERTSYADQLVIRNAAGASIGAVSLSGLPEALLYIDERQGRLRTPGALVRTGRSGAVPAPPPVPVVQAAPVTSEAPLVIPPARITQLRREAGCSIDEIGGPDDVVTGALGGGRTLVLLACGAGAYNISGVVFVARREGGRILIVPAQFDLPLEDYEEEQGRRILVNGDWNQGEMALSDFSKGRGLGDCGTRSTYHWDGARFRLTHREEMRACRGSYIFLTTWRAEVRR